MIPLPGSITSHRALVAAHSHTVSDRARTFNAILIAPPGRQLRPSAMNAMALWLFIGITS